MQSVRLGTTGIVAHKNGFGALPIQRIAPDQANALLRKAYHSGFNFFDTARFYTDSEEKIGLALCDVRESIIIASKTMAVKVEDFWEQLWSTTLREQGFAGGGHLAGNGRQEGASLAQVIALVES